MFLTNWCLGLTAGMYTCNGKEVGCPDPAAGLCIQDRAGRTVRASISPDHLAFQVGEAAQVVFSLMLESPVPIPKASFASTRGCPGSLTIHLSF